MITRTSDKIDNPNTFVTLHVIFQGTPEVNRVADFVDPFGPKPVCICR